MSGAHSHSTLPQPTSSPPPHQSGPASFDPAISPLQPSPLISQSASSRTSSPPVTSSATPSSQPRNNPPFHSTDKLLSRNTLQSIIRTDQESRDKHPTNQLSLSTTEQSFAAPVKHKSFTVLDEDEYTATLEYIIQRDFFPDLPELRRQADFLEAEGDGIALRAALSATNGNNSKYHGMSLDAFQSRYTSEDNASFSTILQAQQARQKEKYEWMYNAASKALTLTNATPQLITNSTTSTARQSTTPSTKSIMPPPKAHLVGPWNFVPKSALIFGPQVETIPEFDVSRVAPKSINHTSTRLHTSTTTVTHHPPLSQNPSGISQTPNQHSLASTSYNFISTPSLISELGSETPELTWGEIIGTPQRLNDGPTFKIPPTPKRELVSMRLADQASKQLRRRESPRSIIKTPGSNIIHHRTTMSPRHARVAMLSPAARQLLHRSMGGGNGTN